MSNPNPETPSGNSPQKKERTFIETLEVSGAQLVERIQQLDREADTRRVVIRNEEGKELISMPLTLGLAAGGLLTFGTPVLAALGAIAALTKKIKLEVVREVAENAELPKDSSAS